MIKIKMLPRTPELMHGRDWNGENPAGWFVTEKLNGCRCYWDGTTASSKDGNAITLPARIRDALPPIPLDGEIYAGRGSLEISRRAVQYNQWTPKCQFVAFDRPNIIGNLRERTRNMSHHYGFSITPYICESYAELMDDLRHIQEGGGEGLMIHSPLQTRYEPGRTSRLLKVKHVLPLLD